jgi:hypothetical protein
VDNEVERKRSWPNFLVISRHYPGGAEKTQKKPSVTIVGLRAEISTQDLPNTTQHSTTTFYEIRAARTDCHDTEIKFSKEAT